LPQRRLKELSRLLPDSFTLAILGVVLLSLVLPCRGESAVWVANGSEIAIALLFFLQGARLSRATVVAGMLHWQLHLIILAATFVIFPLLGLALSPLSGTLLVPSLYIGLIFLCTLPSAVQASVIFTSIAGGNVAAALCGASLSSILGMVLTPLLIGLLLHAHGGVSLNGLGSIMLHLLVPFLAGQLVQSWIAAWMQRHERAVRMVDRGSVLLMVYSAFSAATLSGMWSRIPLSSLGVLAVVDTALLVTMLAGTAFAARRFGLSREDEIAIVFCGSKKSLVTGIPMANALFAGASLGLTVLPLMILPPNATDGLRDPGPALCPRAAFGRKCRAQATISARSFALTCHHQAGLTVVICRTEDHRGPAISLFMARLGIELQRHYISGIRHEGSPPHQNSRPRGRQSPADVSTL
jgi:sodium/bile acid cotransporter 7